MSHASDRHRIRTSALRRHRIERRQRRMIRARCDEPSNIIADYRAAR